MPSVCQASLQDKIKHYGSAHVRHVLRLQPRTKCVGQDTVSNARQVVYLS